MSGRVVGLLPTATNTALAILRLFVLIVVWVLILTLSYYGVLLWFLWLFFTVSVRFLKSGKPASKGAGTAAPNAPGSSAPTPAIAASVPSWPPPKSEPAVDHCAQCGGETTDAEDRCLFCGVRLPQVVTGGWHRDPGGSGKRRWFDGHVWTEHLQGA